MDDGTWSAVFLKSRRNGVEAQTLTRNRNFKAHSRGKAPPLHHHNFLIDGRKNCTLAGCLSLLTVKRATTQVFSWGVFVALYLTLALRYILIEGIRKLSRLRFLQYPLDHQTNPLAISHRNRIPHRYALAQSDFIAGFNKQTRTMDGLSTKMYLISQMSTDRPQTLFLSVKRQILRFSLFASHDTLPSSRIPEHNAIQNMLTSVKSKNVTNKASQAP